MSGELPPGHVENDVLVGREGMLFLAGGAHRVLDHVSGALRVTPQRLETSRLNHVQRKGIADRRGFGYLHVVTPDKQSFLPGLWPFPEAPPLRLGQMLLDHLGAEATRIDYPVAMLAEAGAAAASRVDTHYTDHGTILVAARTAALLTGEAQEDLRDRLLDGLTGSRSHKGDLGGKLDPAWRATEPCWEGGWPGRFLTNGVSAINTGLVEIWLNGAARYPRRLAVIGDSFGKNLAKFLQFWFREVLFLRSQFFHTEWTDGFRPHFVLTQNVERYIPNILPDAQRPHALLLPVMRGHPLAVSPEFAETLAALLAVGRPPYARLAREAFGPEG